MPFQRMQGWEVEDYQEQNKVLLEKAGVFGKKANENSPVREIRERQPSADKKQQKNRSNSREKYHDRWFHDKFTYEEDKD